MKWATQGRDGNHASILQTKEHLLFLTDGAVLIVARRTPDGFKEEKRYELGTSATWSLPVSAAGWAAGPRSERCRPNTAVGT